MCDEESVDVGGLVPEETVLYRACSRSNFLTSAKDGVREIAFQKDGRNHKDGLSLALSVAESVKYLNKNHGVIRITVREIHELGYNIAVHFKISDPLHVVIRNLPCTDKGPEEKQLALSISAELAARAKIESATPVAKPIEPTVNTSSAQDGSP